MGIIIDVHNAHFSKFFQWRQDTSCSFLKNCCIGLNSLEFVSKLFSNSMAVLAASAQSLFLKNQESFTPLRMGCTWLYSIANVHFTWPSCCGVLGVVYWKFTPIPACLHSLLKVSFFRMNIMYVPDINIFCGF